MHWLIKVRRLQSKIKLKASCLCQDSRVGVRHVARDQSGVIGQIGRARLKSVRIGLADQFWISLGMANLPSTKNWSFRGRSEPKITHFGAEGNPPM